MAIGAILGGVQAGLGVYGAIKGRKAAKKARKEQKRYIGMALREYSKMEDLYRRQYKTGQINLQKQKAIDIGKTLQHGLATGIGLSSFGDPNATYEANVGRSERARLEDILTERLAGVSRQRANFFSGINVTGPSASSLSESYSNIGQGIGNILSSFSPKASTSGGTIEAPSATPGLDTMNPTSYANLSRRQIGRNSYLLER